MAEPVTARQNAIYDCTHIYLDAFDKKGPIGDLYSKAVAEYLERFIKTENCFMYTLIEKDVIVGFLTACEIPGILSRNIKIDTVAIAPEYQNKGYGTVMMNEFFNLFENAVFSLETKRNSISYLYFSWWSAHRTSCQKENVSFGSIITLLIVLAASLRLCTLLI